MLWCLPACSVGPFSLLLSANIAKFLASLTMIF